VNTLAPLDARLAEERVLGWQTKLHRWAAGDEQQRFGDLFNLVCDPATLLVAWERVKRNRGSKTAGVDGQTRKHIEAVGVEKVLGELRQSLRDHSYAPLPVREHEIPKRGSGKVRKLGIPACATGSSRWRPSSCSSRFSRRTSARPRTDFGPDVEPKTQVRFFIHAPRSYEWAIEGDVENCFAAIHHGLLMEQVRRRVTDKRVLALIRKFLGAGIMSQLGTPDRHAIGHATRGDSLPRPGEHCPLGTRPPLRGGMGVTHARSAQA